MKVTRELLVDKGVALYGSVDYITEQLLKSKVDCGYVEDMFLSVSMELGGFEEAEIMEQMQCFAEEILPVLRRECGGGPDWPESVVSYDRPPSNAELAQ